MNNILQELIILILATVNLLVALYLGIWSIWSSFHIVLYEPWKVIIILSLTCVAMTGHLYILWNLLKFTSSMTGDKK